MQIGMKAVARANRRNRGVTGVENLPHSRAMATAALARPIREYRLPLEGLDFQVGEIGLSGFDPDRLPDSSMIEPPKVLTRWLTNSNPAVVCPLRQLVTAGTVSSVLTKRRNLGDFAAGAVAGAPVTAESILPLSPFPAQHRRSANRSR